MASGKPSYLIIGAGVFGVSTAYHLIEKYPDASVTLVDRDSFDANERVAASWDWNKVVRADYDDFLYCKLALEAQGVFKSDPLWQPYFKQAGIYWASRGNYGRDVLANHKKLGRESDITVLPVDEAKKLYSGLFADADYTDAKEVLLNKAGGFALAGDCLRAVTQRAVELGVKYVTAEVASLKFDLGGSCTGIRTVDGKTLTASKVILCTGAFTTRLLEVSAARTGKTALCAGDRIKAAGITTGLAQLDKEVYKRHENMPVAFQGYTADYGEIPWDTNTKPEKN